VTVIDIFSKLLSGNLTNLSTIETKKMVHQNLNHSFKSLVVALLFPIKYLTVQSCFIVK